jgi:hypothetical protein
VQAEHPAAQAGLVQHVVEEVHDGDSGGLSLEDDWT